MNFVEALVVCALSCWILTAGSAQASQERAEDTVPGSARDRYNSTERSRPTRPPAYPAHAHGTEGHHHHRIAAIVVYVPVAGISYVPYYYAPAAPTYVEQEPPQDAYRDLSGFFYWCSSLAHYYPYVADCPVGWQLVAP